VANGKPGDHPLTDVLVHHLPVYNEQVDRLIVELDAFGTWDNPLISFLMLSFDHEFRRLRDEHRDEQVVTLLSNFAWELRDELRRRSTPST
jgi:hypothetical protein